MTRMRRWLKRGLAAVVVLGLIGGIAGWVTLRSAWLREQVRARIVQEAEKATGGKVEMGKFDFDPGTWRARVEKFVMHGKEEEGAAPFVEIERVDVGVTVVSFLKKNAYVDTLEVTKPRVHIVTYADGTTNIPGPKVSKSGPSVFEQFVSLGARKFVVTEGWFHYDQRRVPVDLRAENLKVEWTWERDGPRYRGKVEAKPVLFHWPKIGPLRFDTEVAMTMDKSGLQFEKAELRQGASRMVVTGGVKDYRSPVVEVDVNADMAMAEYVETLRLPLAKEGKARFAGRFRYEKGVYGLQGKVEGQGLAVREKLFTVAPAGLTADVDLTGEGVKLGNVRVQALGGEFTGAAEIRKFEEFVVKGAVRSIGLDRLQEVERRQRPVAWSGVMAGAVELKGRFVGGGVKGMEVATHLAIEPREGKIPLEGLVRGRYQFDEQAVAFEGSYLKTPATRVDFTGALAQRMEVLLESRDLNDLLPAMQLVAEGSVESLPVQLDGGSARFEGRVTSPLGAPRVQGTVTLKNALYQQYKITGLTGELDADSGRVYARRVALETGASQVGGDVQISLMNWRTHDESEIVGDLDLRKASLEELLAGRKTPVAVKGTVTGRIHLEGYLTEPEALAKLTVTNAMVEDEALERVEMEVEYGPESLVVKNGLVVHKAGRVPFGLEYAYEYEHIDRGTLQFTVQPARLALGAIGMVRKQRPDVDGKASVEAVGKVMVVDGVAKIDRIDGKLGLEGLMLNKLALGGLAIEAKTSGERVTMTAAGKVLDTAVNGRGEWQLTGDANGLGELGLGTLTIAKLNEVLKANGSSVVPFDGKFHADIVVSGALRKPQTMRARANLTQVELTPRADGGQLSAQVLEELRLTNAGPVIVELDAKGFQIAQARFQGKGTNIGVTGTVATSARNAWNVVLNGGLNLGIFQNYVAGLRTSGAAEVNATVRGTLGQPQLGGRMTIVDANVSHRDLPNSIEKASGLVVFDRNRALLQNFKAQTGGGEMKLTGFVTFGGDEEITYRLNGVLEKVRIRYPEGVSTTADASLSLTGTADQSLLSGVVTILRSGFRQRTDFGSLLLEPAKPVPVPTGSSLLRGMQFDVRLKSAPNLQLETSLTTGLQATVDLRVKGSPLKPVLLGTVGLNQGELNFFGTTYTITRGTVSFFNAARIEPVLDLDFETVVRAVTVNMTVSGPIDKPNITYRSDPPLQPGDIIALLAVGRTPTSGTVATATQTNVSGAQNGFYAGTETLLGQALSAGVSGRLQRFFGVSRVKIDPQLLGVDTTPQARLTIEQQISRAITLTYVTNLTGTLQQLVRLQWDLSKNWSVTGVRDENGVIGSDVQYRKRFK